MLLPKHLVPYFYRNMPQKQVSTLQYILVASLITLSRIFSATYREMLAIIKTLKYFHLYLHCTKFIVYTDNWPLMYFFSQPNLLQQQLCWAG